MSGALLRGEAGRAAGTAAHADAPHRQSPGCLAPSLIKPEPDSRALLLAEAGGELQAASAIGKGGREPLQEFGG